MNNGSVISINNENGAVAHIRLNELGEPIHHKLDDHLRETAIKAKNFADRFNSGDWAYIAGMLHDIGKFQTEFQDYLISAVDPNGHIENAPKRVDHSTVGAEIAIQQWGTTIGGMLAYLIAGHHAGLPDYESDEIGQSALSARLERSRQSGSLKRLVTQSQISSLKNLKKPLSKPPGKDGEEQLEGLHLWLRMLFSCLTDADFLDTEAFMDEVRRENRGDWPQLSELLPHFDAYMSRFKANTHVNKVRAQVLSQCREAASLTPGRFSLTVPTGGGKTLASLAFALHHAKIHGKRRIIYVIPYTSIIEQTADVFRQVFRSLGEVVVEHHSNAETNPETENSRTRLACENWDAPMIVTTSVQFFESLYAARTSRVRKLHNLVDCVVVLDEAQLIPPEFRSSLLTSLRLLTDHYGVTLVLSTATQPALGSVAGLEVNYRGLEPIQEIVSVPAELHRQLRRVSVRLPVEMNRSVTWEELAEELIEHPSLLCIVNRRDDCRALHRLMPPGSIHLSALMCGQHRADTIKVIRRRLQADESVRVISTQLVEAGVDLDFPVVYRAMAGLDSIAQAAGRCNREGRLDGLGEVRIFIPPSKTIGLMAKAEQAAREVLHGYTDDPLDPGLYRQYFENFYRRIDPDRKSIEQLLTPYGGIGIYFRTAAERFKLIDDGYQLPVFVAYGEEGWKLIDQLQRLGPERWLMRRMQRLSVNISQRHHERLMKDGFIEEIHPGIYIQCLNGLYDDEVGLVTDPTLSNKDFVL
ncbi:MAG: CRISPR-associated endonuclease Cas3'' [Candidatus Thiodiazotropha sp. (ex Clathrolucina costata)]|nr:CRISPR-associated endonuclease Cas3'' [Candidatus Thiodiazotropha taylori]